MNKTELMIRLREIFEMTKVEKFLDAKVNDGSILRVEGDSLVEGAKVVLVSADGASIAPNDGEFTLDDGTKIEIKASVIEKITPATAPIEPTAEATTEDVTAAAAPAPVETPAEAPTTPTMGPDGGIDLGMISEILSQLSERVANLEAKLGDANAEAPAAFSAEKPKVTYPTYEKGQKIDDYLSQVRAFNRSKAESFGNTRPLTTNNPIKPSFLGNIKGSFNVSNGN